MDAPQAPAPVVAALWWNKGTMPQSFNATRLHPIPIAGSERKGGPTITKGQVLRQKGGQTNRSDIFPNQNSDDIPEKPSAELAGSSVQFIPTTVSNMILVPSRRFSWLMYSLSE